MKPITVSELCDLCKEQIALGNGNKSIMISDDDEGNGYHYLWFNFSKVEDILEDEYSPLNYTLNENVAPKEDTIILG